MLIVLFVCSQVCYADYLTSDPTVRKQILYGEPADDSLGALDPVNTDGILDNLWLELCLDNVSSYGLTLDEDNELLQSVSGIFDDLNDAITLLSGLLLGPDSALDLQLDEFKVEEFVAGLIQNVHIWLHVSDLWYPTAEHLEQGIYYPWDAPGVGHQVDNIEEYTRLATSGGN